MGLLQSLSSIFTPQQPVVMPLQQLAEKSIPIESKLYDSFAQAETGSEKNKWIRTKHHPKGGSTAFGPVQITLGKLKDYVNRSKETGLSAESINFAKKVLIPMQEKMSKYGGKDMVKGFEMYDYGGTGNFDVGLYGEQYIKLAKEMLIYDYNKAKHDINKTIRLWRGVSDDKRYNDEVIKTFGGK